MRTAISSRQWQPWTAVSALLGLSTLHSRGAAIGLKASCSLPFTTEASARHPFKRQLYTTYVEAGGWEPHGSSPTACGSSPMACTEKVDQP